MPLKQINSTDRVIQQIQTNTASAINDIESGPFVNGVQLEGIHLTSGQDNLVAHFLSRQLQNWILTSQGTNSTVWSPTTTQLGGKSSDDKYINLHCTASCVINVWFS